MGILRLLTPLLLLFFASEAQAYIRLLDLIAADKDCTYSKADGTGTITCYLEDYRNLSKSTTVTWYAQMYSGTTLDWALRYRANVPKGATISNAYIFVKSYNGITKPGSGSPQTDSGSPNVTLSLIDDVDCDPFTITEEAAGSTTVEWNSIESMTGNTWYNSPDIKSLITAWIGNEAYKYDSYIGLYIGGNGGTGRRHVYGPGHGILTSPYITITFTGGEPVMVMHMADPRMYNKQTVRFSLFNTAATDKLSVKIDGASVYNQAVGTVGAATLEDAEVVVDFSALSNAEHTLTAELTDSGGTAYATTTTSYTWTGIRNATAPTVGLNEFNGITLGGTTKHIPLLVTAVPMLNHPATGDVGCDWYNGQWGLTTSGYSPAGKLASHVQPYLTNAADITKNGCNEGDPYYLWVPSTGGNQWDGYAFSTPSKPVIDFTLNETFEGTGYVTTDHTLTPSASGVDPDTISGALAGSQSLKLDGTAAAPAEATLTITPKTVQNVTGIGKVGLKFLLKDITATHQETDLLRFYDADSHLVAKLVWERTDNAGGKIAIHQYAAAGYWTSSAVTFANADNSIAATSIDNAFDVGYGIEVTGSVSNDGLYTIDSESDGPPEKIIVSGGTITDEAPGATVVFQRFKRTAVDIARNTLYYIWVKLLTPGANSSGYLMLKYATSDSEPADCTTSATGCVYLTGSADGADNSITSIQFVAEATSTLLIDNIEDTIDDMKDMIDGTKSGYTALGGYVWMDEKSDLETIYFSQFAKLNDPNHLTGNLYGGLGSVFPNAETNISTATRNLDEIFPETNKWSFSGVKTTPTDYSVIDYYFWDYSIYTNYPDIISYVDSIDFFMNRHHNVAPLMITFELAHLTGSMCGAYGQAVGNRLNDLTWESCSCATAATCSQTDVPITGMEGGTFKSSRKAATFLRKGAYYTVNADHVTMGDKDPLDDDGTYWTATEAATPYITWTGGIDVTGTARKRYVQVGKKGAAEILDVRIIASDPRMTDYFGTAMHNDHIAINKGGYAWEVADGDTLTEYECTDAITLPKADLAVIGGCSATGVTATVGGDSSKLPYVDATCIVGGAGAKCRTPASGGTNRLFWNPVVTPEMFRQGLFLSFIHGATGVVYFPYWNASYYFPRTTLASLKTEITYLTDMILNTKSPNFSHDARKVYKKVSVTAGRVDATGRRYNNQDWIIASRVYAHNENTDEITATFTVAGLAAGTSITKYASYYGGASSTLTAGDGFFTDTFHPQDVHIYQLGAGSSTSTISGVTISGATIQ